MIWWRWPGWWVFIQHGLDGSCKRSVRLDPVAAATVNEALATRPDSSTALHEPRSLAQRRADKLADICHWSLHGDDLDGDEGLDDHNDGGGAEPEPDSGVHPDRGDWQGADPCPGGFNVGGSILGACSGSDPEPDRGDGAGGSDPGPGYGGGPDWGVGPWSRRGRRRAGRGGAPSATDVIIDLETLAGGDLTVVERLRSELASGAPISGPGLDRLLCDTAFRALIVDGPRTVLAYNRATPVIPYGLRRAVKARDQQCVFPGCDTSRTWCDLHHVIPRNRGGPTNHDNLVLLCRFHHRLVHDGGWHLARAPDGTITVTSP